MTVLDDSGGQAKFGLLPYIAFMLKRPNKA